MAGTRGTITWAQLRVGVFVLVTLLILGTFIFYVTGGAVFAPTSETPPASLVLTGVTVIDATGAPARPDQTVVITGDRITALGAAGRVLPRGTRVVNARGLYLIPGLWDMHVHLSMTGPSALPVLLAYGVTSVRDLGGELAELRAWREQIATGRRTGPRLRLAGPILESRAFLELLRRVAAALGPPLGPVLASEVDSRLAVGTSEEAASAVAALAEQGVDAVKIRSVASPEVFHAIAAAARRQRLPLAGHEPQGISLREAAAAGQRSFEHALFAPDSPELSDDQAASLAAELTASSAWLTPTLISFRTTRLVPPAELEAVLDDTAGAREPRRRHLSARLLEHWHLHRALDRFESPLDWPAIYARGLRSLGALHRHGARLLAGTDLGARLVFPGSSLHEELALLVSELGMSPLAALQAATREPARWFGLEDSLGTVEVGKLADLVLLEANPLEDIRHTQKIAGVVFGGRYFDRAALDRLLAEAAAGH